MDSDYVLHSFSTPCEAGAQVCCSLRGTAQLYRSYARQNRAAGGKGLPARQTRSIADDALAMNIEPTLRNSPNFRGIGTSEEVAHAGSVRPVQTGLAACGHPPDTAGSAKSAPATGHVRRQS
jgi:hypothetical protein